MQGSWPENIELFRIEKQNRVYNVEFDSDDVLLVYDGAPVMEVVRYDDEPWISIMSDEEKSFSAYVSRWVEAPITKDELEEVKTNKKDLYSLYAIPKVRVTDIDCHGEVLNTFEIPRELIEEDSFPEEGVMLYTEGEK